MQYSSVVKRIDGEGAAGWAVHFAAWEARRQGRDVIILSIGDPDFATPEPIIDAAVDALRKGDTHYTDIPGRPALRELIAARFAARAGGNWGRENTMVFTGTQGSLFAASLCLLEHGDEVIALEPMYLTYEATLTVGGATLVRVAQSAGSGFRIDASLVAEAITPRTRAIVITNPNNPTGSVATRTELEAVAALAIEHDLWVISDEVYADLVFEGEHVAIASLPGMAERTVTVSSLSKSHAMTGWRIGWAIGPSELVEHMGRLGLTMSYGVPGFIQAAAIEALQHQDAAVADMRNTYLRRRDLVHAELSKAPDLPVLSPQGAMYVMVDVRAFAPSATQFAWDLFDATGVSVLDAGAFGPAAEGWVRISFTISDDDLREGCRRIVDFTRNRPRT